MNAARIVEAVLFASDAPLGAEEICRADTALDEDRVEEAIRELQAEYDDTDRSFQIVRLGGGFQILTRPEYAPYLERFDTVPRPNRLSGPALETLAIVAYRQPIGRVEVEYVRGVGSAGVIRTLQDRGLIDVVGRGEGLGRPLLYGTTRTFLEHFGFDSVEELPRPEELPVVLRDRVPILPEDVDATDDGASEPEIDEGWGGSGEDRDALIDRLATEASEADSESESEAGANGSSMALPHPGEPAPRPGLSHSG